MPNIRRYDHIELTLEQLREKLNDSNKDIKLSDLLFKEQEEEHASIDFDARRISEQD